VSSQFVSICNTVFRIHGQMKVMIALMQINKVQRVFDVLSADPTARLEESARGSE